MKFRGEAILVLLLTAPLCGVVAQSGGASLESLQFMSGCWHGASGGRSTIEETYTTPSANVMLGTTRYLRDGTTTMFEFSLITRDSTGITLLPYPRGRPSEDGFRLTSVVDDVAWFEAPEHDFPKRISYRRITPDELLARIDGGAESDQVTEWRLTRTRCPA